MKMRKFLTKASAVALCLAVAAVLCVSAAAAKADFSGTWVLQGDKSQGVPPGMEQTLVVTQEGDRVDAKNTIKGPQGEMVVEDTYVLDGKETDFAPPLVGGGKGKGKRTSKWTADGNGFEVSEEATIDGPEGEAKVKAARRWTLSDSGKTLTIEITLNGPNGESKSKRVFAKK